jgi:multiple sugar transport system permease protein
MSATTPPSRRVPPPVPRRRRRRARFTWSDRLVLVTLVGIPTALLLALVWLPAIASIGLSFTTWDGIGSLGSARWVGLQNYHQIFTIYPPFWPAVRHNLIWLVFLFAVPTVAGMGLAVALDRELRGGRVYQSIFYLPVVLSLALVGFIWQLIYRLNDGLIDGFLSSTGYHHQIDFLGDSRINLWAILVAAGWRHTGYIMILYLAGLKAIDPTLREAAQIDGANGWESFRHVVFPSLRPINVVVAVVTTIEALRNFDIVYVTNHGTNGLEVLSALVTSNILGEATRIGFGSAIAVILLVISLGPISAFLLHTFRTEARE